MGIARGGERLPAHTTRHKSVHSPYFEKLVPQPVQLVIMCSKTGRAGLLCLKLVLALVNVLLGVSLEIHCSTLFQCCMVNAQPYINLS